VGASGAGEVAGLALGVASAVLVVRGSQGEIPGPGALGCRI